MLSAAGRERGVPMNGPVTRAWSILKCGIGETCGALLRPEPGDCCVYRSYDSVPCPPIQGADRGGNDGTAAPARS